MIYRIFLNKHFLANAEYDVDFKAINEAWKLLNDH